MRLLNQSLRYLLVPLLVIVGIWSVVFYINMLDEINDSIDDGLNNSKLLIIQRAASDSAILQKNSFNESNYAIQEITKEMALTIKDTHIDTALYMQDEEDMEPVRLLSTAFELNGKFYRLQVFSSMVEEDDLIEDLFWSVFWLYLTVLASIVLINKIALQKLWKPFYEILQQLKAFRLDGGKKTSGIKTNIKEFNELKNAANTLMQHSLETYANQKQFTENAAHELQTPLAIAAGKLELLLEKDDIAPAHATDIVQILQIIERLARLNKSLLLLAKIENSQYSATQTISINKTVHECISDLEDFAAYKNIEISVHEEENPEIEMDATLANILVSNLIKNAIFHNIQNGRIIISITKTTLTIGNTGKARALDPHKVFSRFYKEATAQSSTGLGLAVVKAICKLYRFDISYHYSDIHCFEVQFKDR
ncbi:HAMP domain-containing sensor histidine kinase [Agriterribacter sp.]|uniref:sensor histidine kinase n=1 Tax=Agriterribacter sp. TaxID=2821509 RepID=UPI002CA053E2|nr:HAMP domain-containing sensor histidine kinase [Agriterribacter sp.]HRP55054.1 HAMP domain-containing sensor histidine kinase [Agriterribacter sp.]